MRTWDGWVQIPAVLWTLTRAHWLFRTSQPKPPDKAVVVRTEQEQDQIIIFFYLCANPHVLIPHFFWGGGFRKFATLQSWLKPQAGRLILKLTFARARNESCQDRQVRIETTKMFRV